MVCKRKNVFCKTAINQVTHFFQDIPILTIDVGMVIPLSIMILEL